MKYDTITPEIAARYLNSDPQTIRLQARKDSLKLGFPVVIVGSRVKIPRIPFLKFMGIKTVAPRKIYRVKRGECDD